VTKEKKNIIDRAWDLFTSVKLAVVIFSLIALTSIVGTILEQRAPSEKNIQILSGLVGDSLATPVYKVLEAMGFINMYESWWFSLLLVLFSANLLICTLDRFPRIWKLVKEPMKPLPDEQFKTLGIKRDITLKGKPDNIKETVGEALKKIGMKYTESSGEEGLQLYAQKGKYSRLGVFITHISMIFILVGSFIGSNFGFKGSLNLPEGTAYSMAFEPVAFLSPESREERIMLIDTVQEAGGNLSVAASKLRVSKERLRGRMQNLGLHPLEFQVLCEDFEVEFYGNSEMPKEYTSHLRVYDKGVEVMDKWIEVNAPLVYKGYTFYQSSYGVMGDPTSYEYILKATSGTGQSRTFMVRLGEKITIPGTQIMASVNDFTPALRFDKSGNATTYSDLMNNPAIRLKIWEGGRENAKWVLRRYPATWTITGSNTIQFVDVMGAQYTGLQVRKDPGVWIVYLGCLLMSIGLYIAFFMTHKKIWVKIDSKKGESSIMLCATVNKGRESYERKIDNMLSLLREGGK
jgi:cytochrome c biogenesis protein